MYVDAYHDRKQDKVLVSERIKGKRILQEFRPTYFFYVEDPKGKYYSTTGKRLSKISASDNKNYRKELNRYINSNKQTYEANIKPIFKTLEEHYLNKPVPNLNKTYFDIEADWDKERGYAPPDDPFNRITAISLYNNWEETLYSLALAPPTLTLEQAREETNHFDNHMICDSEEQMLILFLELIQDSDVLLTWNGNMYDIPYTVNRTKRILGNDAVKKFCLWNQSPIKRDFEKYGKEVYTYDLVGRIHLDMLELYQKYTYTEQPSFSLDAIGKFETGEEKVPYDGSLDQLYKNDFKKFVDYSRQDSMLLYKIDKAKDHVNLAFKIAHDNAVPIATVMGAVALSDNAIALEAHRRNLRVPDRNKKEILEDTKIAGGLVITPEPGLATDLGSVDLTSLYPSVFRAMNLSNETIFGQVRQDLTKPLIEQRRSSGMTFAEAWHDIVWVLEVEEIVNKTDKKLVVEIENGENIELTAKEIHEFIFNNNLILTANGTLIRTDIQGIVPSLLERWFFERKQYKKMAEAYERLHDEGFQLDEDLLKQLEGN